MSELKRPAHLVILEELQTAFCRATTYVHVGCEQRGQAWAQVELLCRILGAMTMTVEEQEKVGRRILEIMALGRSPYEIERMMRELTAKNVPSQDDTTQSAKREETHG